MSEDDDGVLWRLAFTFASISMVAIGGANAVVPEIHRTVLASAWMDEATFSNLFAISQASPGPNVLIVSLVGWQVAGVSGLLVATAAMLVPSCLLAFVMGRFVTRVQGTMAYQLIQEALVPIAIGLIAASGLVMAQSASRGAALILVTLAAAAMCFLTKINPLAAILGGMAVGALTLLV